MEAIEGEQTVIQLAERFSVHPTQATQWKSRLPERAAAALGAHAEQGHPPDIEELHAKSGSQALEIDFLAGALGRIGDASAKR